MLALLSLFENHFQSITLRPKESIFELKFPIIFIRPETKVAHGSRGRKSEIGTKEKEGQVFRISLNKRKILSALESGWDSVFSAKLFVLCLVRNACQRVVKYLPTREYNLADIFLANVGRCSISTCSTFVELCAQPSRAFIPTKISLGYVSSRTNFRSSRTETSAKQRWRERLLKILNVCRANERKCSRGNVFVSFFEKSFEKWTFHGELFETETTSSRV